MNAQEIIELQQRLESEDATFRSSWQDTASYIFPRESNITDVSVPGAPKTQKIYDTTAITESEMMTSGLLTNLVPAGQKFFGLATSDKEVQELDVVKSYLSKGTGDLTGELF